MSQQEVEIFSSYKYRGTVIDQKLSFTENVDFVYKKLIKNTHNLLRKLKSFDVILESVYRSLIESVLTFNIVSWYGNLTVKNRTKLSCIVRISRKL